MAIASVVTFLLFLSILKLEGFKLDLKFLNKKEASPNKEDVIKWNQGLSDGLSQYLGEKIYRQQNVGYVVCAKGSRSIATVDGAYVIHRDIKDAQQSAQLLAVLNPKIKGVEVRKITFDYIQH